MKANHDKCRLLLSTQGEADMQIRNVTIKSTSPKKTLRIDIDNKLRFERHIENICKKATRKLNALSQLANYMDLTERRIVMNIFLKF